MFMFSLLHVLKLYHNNSHIVIASQIKTNIVNCPSLKITILSTNRSTCYFVITIVSINNQGYVPIPVSTSFVLTFIIFIK